MTILKFIGDAVVKVAEYVYDLLDLQDIHDNKDEQGFVWIKINNRLVCVNEEDVVVL